MQQSFRSSMMRILYALGILTTCWFIFLFMYQYIAAIGIAHDVLKAFVNPRILFALWVSFTSSVATALLSVFLGVPLAYLYATKRFTGKTIIQTLTIDVPQTFPPVAEGIILLLMLGEKSPFHISLAYTYTALIIAKFYVSAPFVIALTTRKFGEIRESGLDITAKTLGADTLQIFGTIFLPLGLKDIIAGMSLCWSRAMGELGASLIFAGVIPFKTEEIPTFIAQNSSDTAPALAATILGTTAAIIALLSFKAITRGGGLWKALFYEI